MQITVIGGGSWATAIVKILTENTKNIGWWMRDKDNVSYIKKHHHNQNYLRSTELATNKIEVCTDLNRQVNKADCLIIAVPSAFLKSALKPLTINISEKLVFSAVKGIVPDENLIVGEFFNEHYQVPLEKIGVLTGPCHAEEVGLERLSYLTVASKNQEAARNLAKHLNCHYIKTTVSNDIIGTEYAAVLKNIYALAAGIYHGLGYGDNFQAVLVSNAIQEMKRFIKAVYPLKRDINGSAYLGDLLVTAYSQFSRNRMFGNMIGKGYTVRSAQLEMNMIAEGYYATKLIREVRKKKDVKMPIAKAVYKVLYEQKNPTKVMAKLANKFE
jgi:glycerol-3-phosphate dehydrogenase (NAD(P)+)